METPSLYRGDSGWLEGGWGWVGWMGWLEGLLGGLVGWVCLVGWLGLLGGLVGWVGEVSCMPLLILYRFLAHLGPVLALFSSSWAYLGWS